LPDVRFLNARFLNIRFLFSLSFAHASALSLQLPMKFGNVVQVETSRYLTKITPIAKVFAAKHTASLQLLCTVGGNQARLDARTEFKNLEPSLRGGVEAGRCITSPSDVISVVHHERG